jgi:hypothetical protein
MIFQPMNPISRKLQRRARRQSIASTCTPGDLSDAELAACFEIVKHEGQVGAF